MPSVFRVFFVGTIFFGISFYSILLRAEATEQPYSWKRQKPVKHSRAEVKKTCRLYNGQYISYYGQVFEVRSCVRHEIVGSDNIMVLTADPKNRIQRVSAAVIAKIPLGIPNADLAASAPIRSCKRLEGRFTLDKANNIYLIKGCKLLLFPDYETFQEYRQVNNSFGQPLIEISDKEWKFLGLGKVQESILPKSYRDLVQMGKTVDVIPVDEACKGLNGRFATYYSLLYKIQSCKKRQVNNVPEFLAAVNGQGLKFTELTSDQWISLPNGEPYSWKK